MYIHVYSRTLQASSVIDEIFNTVNRVNANKIKANYTTCIYSKKILIIYQIYSINVNYSKKVCENVFNQEIIRSLMRTYITTDTTKKRSEDTIVHSISQFFIDLFVHHNAVMCYKYLLIFPLNVPLSPRPYLLGILQRCPSRGRGSCSRGRWCSFRRA